MSENDALREKRRASGQKGAATTKRGIRTFQVVQKASTANLLLMI